jgi:hypothetical protein
MKLWFSGHIFEKARLSNFIKIRPVVAELFHADGRADRKRGIQTETDRQTNMTKLIVGFRNFANVPKDNLLLKNKIFLTSSAYFLFYILNLTLAYV